MAVAYDNDTGVVSSATGTSVSVSHTCSGSNRAVFVGAFFDVTSGQIDGMVTTYAGNSPSGELWDAQGVFNNQRSSGAYFKESIAPTGAQTVTVTQSPGGSGVYAKTIVAVSLTGVDQTTSIGAVPTPVKASSGTTPSITVASVVAGGMCVDFCAMWFASGTPTAGANQIEQYKDAGATVSGFCSGSSTQNSADGGVMSWSKSSGDDYIIGAVEFKPASGGYTITASGGSYAVTGTAASLKRGRKVVAAGGSYAVSGTAASLEYGREVAAAGGSYAVSGTAASFLRTYIAAADSGSYAVSGTAAALEYGRKVSADGGSYAVTGSDAALEYGRVLAAAGGSYEVTGTAASLLKTWLLDAASGSYAVTGSSASLEFGRLLSAEGGSYAVAGTAANLVYTPAGAYLLAVDGGSYSLSGADASLEFGRLLAADGGSYAISGTAADLIYTPAVGGSIIGRTLTGAGL